MSPTTQPADAASPPLRLGIVLLRERRLVGVATAVAVALTLALWLVLPKVYTASTVLVPAAGQPGGGAGAALVAQLPGGLPNMFGGGDPQQRLIGTILRSRALREAVAAQDSLPEHRRALMDILWRRTTLDRRTDDGSIVITVSARDPQLAASTANRFASAINEIATRISMQAAARKNAFLEEQLRTARDRLVQTEQQLLSFQQLRNAPEPQEQASRTLQAAAQLQQEINQAELEVARLRRTATADNPQLRSGIADLAARREQLRQLAVGRQGDPVFIPLRKGPELRVESTRLMREFKKDEQVYVSLTAALAQTQIDENNNLPVLAVLDPAVPPTTPSGSILKRMVIAGLLGFLAGAMLAIGRELAWRHWRPPSLAGESRPSYGYSAAGAVTAAQRG